MTSVSRRKYVLIAYVCDCGEVRRVNDVGVSSLMSTFIRRPDSCKYAILRHGDKYLAVDMFNLLTDGTDVMLSDTCYKSFQTEDAAIAAAHLIY